MDVLFFPSPDETREYQYEKGNRLTGYGATELALDRAGNLRTSAPKQAATSVASYQYDDQNRPAVYLANNRLQAAYHYNAQGQRTDKVLPDRHFRYRYHATGQLLAETQYSRDDNDNLKLNPIH
ncbi:hypothetical protein [Endozoicomonas sp. ALE010]|uniref:hypothetical protein n=1 Tax=Endozoicomonas sp. ALE010 TaxID=3403081 RepID=UPI003BB49F3C